mmetsp:Transcript_75030/g.152324  ORF Transcript_75030/g.152324 Transcript_75030/m.152324 type:complete len:378 (+) Transcript_75030:1609-2742(+)
MSVCVCVCVCLFVQWSLSCASLYAFRGRQGPFYRVDFRVVPVGDHVVLDGIPVLDVSLQKEKPAEVGHDHPGQGKETEGYERLSLEKRIRRRLDVLEAAVGGLEGGVDRIDHPAVGVVALRANLAARRRRRVRGGNVVGVGACRFGHRRRHRRRRRRGHAVVAFDLAEAVVVGLVPFPVELGVSLVFAHVRRADGGLDVALGGRSRFGGSTIAVAAALVPEKVRPDRQRRRRQKAARARSRGSLWSLDLCLPRGELASVLRPKSVGRAGECQEQEEKARRAGGCNRIMHRWDRHCRAKNRIDLRKSTVFVGMKRSGMEWNGTEQIAALGCLLHTMDTTICGKKSKGFLRLLVGRRNEKDTLNGVSVLSMRSVCKRTV